MSRSDEAPTEETIVELGARLRFALEMVETGVTLKRQNLRREYPAADPEEIERLVDGWLTVRPGAESGDGAGRPVDRFGADHCSG